MCSVVSFAVIPSMAIVAACTPQNRGASARVGLSSIVENVPLVRCDVETPLSRARSCGELHTPDDIKCTPPGAFQALTQQQQEPRLLISRMTDAVHQFVGDAEQSDDLTMMAIQYIKQQSDVKMRKSLVLTNDTQEVPRLDTFVEEVCQAVGFNQDVTTQITAAVKEAVVNVMKYAYPPGTPGDVTIEGASNDVRLKFTIIDSGKPFDPTVQSVADATPSATGQTTGGQPSLFRL